MKTVLFVCTQNAGRSQMAEALFNRLAPSDMRAESAGQRPRSEGVWPAVIEVLAEVGIDISSNRPRKLRPEMQMHADWAITLACPSASWFDPGYVTAVRSRSPERQQDHSETNTHTPALRSAASSESDFETLGARSKRFGGRRGCLTHRVATRNDACDD